MSVPEDTDYICNIGGPKKTHIVGGPDKDTPFDPTNIGTPRGGYVTYNGHPVTTQNCDKHTNEFIETARRFAHERHKKIGTQRERWERAEQSGEPIVKVSEDEEGTS